jgi:hypothetical protein
MENKQTAVNWLWDKLLEETETGELRYHLKHDIVKMFEQALQMEKEHIKNAFDDGWADGRNYPYRHSFETPEQYYTETYGPLPEGRGETNETP